MRYMHVVQGATDSAIAMLDDDRARSGHGSREAVELVAQTGEVIPLFVVTPSGLEGVETPDEDPAEMMEESVESVAVPLVSTAMRRDRS